MKSSDLKELTADELAAKLEEARSELFNLRFQMATSQLDNTARVKTVKKDIARILTQMRANEIKSAQKASQEKEDQTMSDERNSRKVRQGVVVSAASDKTIVVEIKERKQHSVYKKMMNTTRKLHAHDEKNEAGVGDIVRIAETRPLSKMKRWRLLEIVEKAKQARNRKGMFR